MAAAGSHPAAAACATSSKQGYKDWYLPSEYELLYMYAAAKVITQTAVAHGGSVFADIKNAQSGSYWSSTESSDASKALAIFSGTQGYYVKTNIYSVRCVRTF